jgi:CBS domain
MEHRVEILKAQDVMTSPVVTVKPSASVREVAKIFLERRISAVPVVDVLGKLVGIISEGDLMHRSEAQPIAIRRPRCLGFRGGRGAPPERIPEPDMANLPSERYPRVARYYKLSYDPQADDSQCEASADHARR